MNRVTGVTRTFDHFDMWDMFELCNEEEKKACFKEFSQLGFCMSLKPFEAAIEAVEELRTFLELYVVTSPHHSRNWTYERTEWLMQHFGFKFGEIAHMSAKHIVRANGLLDDKPGNVIAWHEEHPEEEAMLWHISNTRNIPLPRATMRVHTWAEVIERMRLRFG